MHKIGHYLKEKKQKVIGLMKDELVGKITTEFVAFRPKTHSCLTNNNNESKKS